MSGPLATPPRFRVTVERAGEALRIRLEGDLLGSGARDLDRALRGLATRAREPIVFDLTGLARADSLGLAALAVWVRRLSRRGRSVAVEGMPREPRAVAESLPWVEPAPPPARPSLLERLGAWALGTWEGLWAAADFVGRALAATFLLVARPRRGPKGAMAEAVASLGADAVPVVATIAALLGLILAFQAVYQLRTFGASIYVANLVALSAVRELGPLMTAVVVTGRSGSAIAAELGTMVSNEEVDALKVMGLDPVRFLVAPRLLAVTLTQPLLSGMSALVAILAGLGISALYVGLAPEAYLSQTLRALQAHDVLHGLGKSVLFGWLIVLVASAQGLAVDRSAAAVGRAATKTVVACIFGLILIDGFITTVSTLLS